MSLLATLALAIGLNFFLFLIALLLYSKSAIPGILELNLSSILKIFAYLKSFQEDLDKSVLSGHA